jgi:protein-S-isoprenylcysteine O-methyltransferase Ste14
MQRRTVLPTLFLALKAAFFVAAFPGAVAGYIPLLVLLAPADRNLPPLGVSALGAAAVVAAGVTVLLWCVWDFLAAGKGTLAPVDPPRRLVVRGLYRFTRNPMYNGVVAVVLGEAWLFRSARLLVYALIVAVIFHLFVLLYEEPALAARFGDAYQSYRRAVPRWGFTLHPYKEPS